jgi:starch phosphorylase
LKRRPDGSPLTVEVSLPGRKVIVQVWLAQVGRVPLYLLDANIPANRSEDRDITDQLYGGDIEMRIKQEILLGFGGYLVLEALGLEPTVYHMNEGHSAFLALERMRRLMEKYGLSFAEAREAASAGLVFTTHTAVAAGHDYFPPALMDRYLADYMRALGLSRRDFLALGRQNSDDEQEPFCTTILALRLAAHSNGVSRLHGRVTRKMWQGLWPGLPEDEIPIDSVTNAVHFQSWISREMKELYDRYLGPRWREEVADQTIWQGADRIAGEELWRTHERRRERLVAFCRRRLRSQLERRGASQTAIEAADAVLDPEALTIGFGRRFATYKRATLLLRDPERLGRILNQPGRPVQIIFAGKAHPRDEPGKGLIRQIVEMAHRQEFRRRLVFLEDYDVAVARYLVQGVDVWLNTPLRLQEASGTSGMKATANGVLNLSILDGWWDEAFRPEVGWAIGRREKYDDSNYQDQVEAEALYGLLEQEVVPAFYDRGSDGLPRRWIGRMRASIQTLCRTFTTHRMVGEYTERYYLHAAGHYTQLTADGLVRAKALAAWKGRLQKYWSRVRVEAVGGDPIKDVQVGGEFRVQAKVHLGALTPDEVAVELYMGHVDAAGEIIEAEATPMQPVGPKGEGTYLYQASAVTLCGSGLYGYTLRVLPRHPDLTTPFLPGLIVWA